MRIFLLLISVVILQQAMQAQIPYREERTSTKMRLVKLIFDSLDFDTLPYTVLVRNEEREARFDLEKSKSVSWCTLRTITELMINNRPARVDVGIYDLEILLFRQADTMKISLHGISEANFQLEGIVFHKGTYVVSGWKRKDPLFIENWQEFASTEN